MSHTFSNCVHHISCCKTVSDLSYTITGVTISDIVLISGDCMEEEALSDGIPLFVRKDYLSK